MYAGRGVRIGGGGRHDPWATLVLGDLVFVGDEAFVNVCRPVLVGAEVFLTMRSIVVTHNVGHSLLEGFENRFAGVVLEDRSQIGMGTIVYAGCRVGRETIVGSGSYVVSDLPAGKLAIGVPARVAGSARRELSRPRRDALARRIVEELHELLELKGHEVTPLADEDGAYGFELRSADSPARIVYVEKLAESGRVAAGAGETIVLTLGLDGTPPAGCTVLDLLAREVVGGQGGGVVLDSVREFCRKRGIRFRPLPWRYRGGLI